MRVDEGKTPLRPDGHPTPARFGSALRRAAAGRSRTAVPPPSREPAGPPVARPLGVRREAAARAMGELRARRDAFREEERSPTAASAALAGPQGRFPDGVAEVRALVRALPVAIEAARVREGEPLSLSFGRSLSVEIRSGAGGVEIVLRPAEALARAASAELPALVAALRARGIAVARAEVRGRSPGSAARPR